MIPCFYGIIWEKKKTIILSKAHYEWMYLKLQNIKSINEYIPVIFKINSQLKLCEENVTEEDMLKKENIQYISCPECAPAVAISKA